MNAFLTGFRRGLLWPIAWPLTWLLYGIGHLSSRLILNRLPDTDAWERACAIFFWVYQRCMNASVRVQDACGLPGPWRDA